MERRPKRTGRPKEFAQRVRLTLLLEATELRALKRRAAAEGVSATRWVRLLVQTALGKGA